MAEDRGDNELEQKLRAWVSSAEIPLPAEVQQRVGSRLKASLKPVNPLPPNRVLALQFLLVFVSLAAALIAALEKAGFHLMTATQISAMGAVLAGGGIYCAAQLPRLMVPGSRVAAPWARGLALILAGAGAAMALLFPWKVPPAFAAEGWPCAVLEVAIALPATAVFFLMAQRGALFASAGLGATLPALAVFLALMADQAQCMFPQAPHLLVWHGGTAAILIATGAMVGRAMERRQR